MKKLRDDLDFTSDNFLIRLKSVCIDIFRYRDGETPFLIGYGASLDTSLASEQQVFDSVDLLDFLGWTRSDLVITF